MPKDPAAKATPRPLKKATITLIVDDEVSQNEFKNWLKSCPFSYEGGQTVTWEKIPLPGAAAEDVAAPGEPTD